MIKESINKISDDKNSPEINDSDVDLSARKKNGGFCSWRNINFTNHNFYRFWFVHMQKVIPPGGPQ